MNEILNKFEFIIHYIPKHENKWNNILNQGSNFTDRNKFKLNICVENSKILFWIKNTLNVSNDVVIKY